MSQSTLLETLKHQGGIISAQQFNTLADNLQTDTAKTASWLLQQCKSWAVAPISQFHVAALVHAKDALGDDFYAVGVNVEVPGFGLECAVHGEQTALHNAWLHGACELVHIYINAAPCGYCRQFMNEFSAQSALGVSFNDTCTDLPALLPHAFGPKDLNVTDHILNRKYSSLGREAGLAQQLQASYAPYSGGLAAVDVLYKGRRYVGRYIENAAFNPSLNPFLAALSQVALSEEGIDYGCIETVSLWQKHSLKSHAEIIGTMVNSVCPNAVFDVIVCD